jgi:hypothetical protein
MPFLTEHNVARRYGLLGAMERWEKRGLAKGSNSLLKEHNVAEDRACLEQWKEYGRKEAWPKVQIEGNPILEEIKEVF